MNAPTIEFQTILKDGKPAFVVIPYDEFLRNFAKPRIPADGTIPHEVVELIIKHKYSLPRAWREYLKLTQAEVAERMGVTQPALSQLERTQTLRKASREKLATALGVHAEQLR
jgi:predicted XRE-type DNA-binding protein